MTDDGAKFDHHAPSMCPVVNTLVEQDWVRPQRDHRVAIEQIREGLSHLAITTPLKSLLVIGPLLAEFLRKNDQALLRNLVTQTFSLPHLRGGFFDHPASTDTLEKSRFDAEKFAVFEKAAIAARTPGVIGVVQPQALGERGPLRELTQPSAELLLHFRVWAVEDRGKQHRARET